MNRIVARLLSTMTPVLLAGFVAAEDVAPAATAPAGPGGKSALAMIFESGWPEWVIIVMSVVAFAVAIQMFITLKRDAIIPPGLADDLHNCFADGVTDEAVENALAMTQNDPSMTAQVIAASLDKKDFGYDAMVASAETTATAEANRWTGKVGWVTLFASTGTMMGLFGTVYGMIGAFMSMAANPAGVDASMLSGTIGGALITTANGLIIAIPMLVCAFVLRGKLNQYILDSTVISNEILDYFRK
jgi:biopolymer transport protein ExbB